MADARSSTPAERRKRRLQLNAMQPAAAAPSSRHAPHQTEAQQLLVVYAFTAADPCELSLPAGAVVTLLRNAMAAGEGWCVVQDEHGQTGLAPISHLGGRGWRRAAGM